MFSVSLISLQNVCIAYIALWAVSPPLIISVWARLLAAAAAGLWLVLELSRRDSILLRPTLPVLLAGIYIVYISAIAVFMDGVSQLARYTQLYILIFFLFFHQSRRNYIETLYPVFWFILIMTPLWLMITVRTTLFENAHAVRIIIRSSEEAKNLAESGVGGYALVYGSLLMLPSLIALVLRHRQIDTRGMPWPLPQVPAVGPLLVLGNAVLIVILILTAGYSIAVLTLAVMLLALALLQNYNTFRLIVVLSVGLFSAIFTTEIVEAVLRILQPFAQGTNFELKIRDVLLSLQNEAAFGTLSHRIELYQRSINTFLEHPILGSMSAKGLGNHSKFLDDLGQYGIFFGSLFIYLATFLPIQKMRSMRKGFGAPAATFVATLLCFGLNNPFAMVGVILFIMFPVAVHMLEARRQDEPVTLEDERHVAA